jgi:hypothetical protein
MALRWGMLVVAALSILAASGGIATQLSASSLRVTVTAVFAVLAPLFWPGCGASTAHTALRVIAWSAAVAASAAIAIVLFARPAQPWLRVSQACAMLLAILLLAHAAAALLERRWRALSADAGSARELSGRAVAVVLALLGTLPFWLGAVAELLAARHPPMIDIVVGSSPLTHLAVASGNDLLRNTWLYEHSNLAVLRVSYPQPAALAWCYGSACLVLALVALASRRPKRRAPEQALK